MSHLPSDIAFTPSVKDIQTRKGSRKTYQRMENGEGWRVEITQDLVTFLAAQRSFFLATVSADGAPYVQHRGGPRGFLKPLDPNTLAFADYRGNKQYISQGNLTDSSKAFIFLIDYATQTRIKLWGEAQVIEDDPELLAKLMPNPQVYEATPEQVIKFKISTWDLSCKQHIPVRYDAEDIQAVIAQRDNRIAELEAEVAALNSQLQSD